MRQKNERGERMMERKIITKKEGKIDRGTEIKRKRK